MVRGVRTVVHEVLGATRSEEGTTTHHLADLRNTAVCNRRRRVRRVGLGEHDEALHGERGERFYVG